MIVVTVILAALASVPWIDAACTAAADRREQRRHDAAMAVQRAQLAQLNRWSKTLMTEAHRAA